MAVLIFILFAVLFCYLMNKWSRELDEHEMLEDREVNIAVANFGDTTGSYDLKRAA